MVFSSSLIDGSLRTAETASTAAWCLAIDASDISAPVFSLCCTELTAVLVISASFFSLSRARRSLTSSSTSTSSMCVPGMLRASRSFSSASSEMWVSRTSRGPSGES